MNATQAVTEMNRLAIIMRAADIAHAAHATAATRAALDEAISEYRAAAYVLETISASP